MEAFLEPVYLNEKMVLNCAAYLFKGVALESESIEKVEKNVEGGLQVGLPFLKSLLSPINAEGRAGRASSEENRSARHFTVGGLHMIALDELRARKMVYTGSADQISQVMSSSQSYIDVKATLKPNDYYGLISTLKTIGPLAAQVLEDYGERLGPRLIRTEVDWSSVEAYLKSVMTILDQLEADYLTSNQLEMVMWSKDLRQPVGVVELDVSDYPPNELRAKLAGGDFHVVGKLINRVGAAGTINLVQKSVLSQAMDLLERLMKMSSSAESTQDFRSQFITLRSEIQKLLLLEIPGPAVRILAMSVCI